MQLQESYGRIFLNDNTATFQCPLSDFQRYEPEYIPVSAPHVIRYWDARRQYVNDGGNAYGDAFFTPERFAYFVGKRAAYQAAYDADYSSVTPPSLPTIYATLSFSGGDGKTPVIGVKLGHPTRGVLQIAGDLRATPTTPGLPVNINFEWRITLRKVVSEFATQPIDSFPVDGCTVVNNVISMAFNPEALGVAPGIYVISDEDFATVPGAAFGLPSDYQVKLVGGAKVFKVLK